MKAARARDRPCSYPDCDELVRRSSEYCRHHLGVVHGASSARTFRCSAACQARHVRCPRCQTLTGGWHPRRLRDGVCYQHGAPSCWSQTHGGAEDEYLVAWTVTCIICSRATEFLNAPPRGYHCEQCGSALLEAEGFRVMPGLRLLRGNLLRQPPGTLYTVDAGGAGRTVSL